MRKWSLPILTLAFLILLSGGYAAAQREGAREGAQDWLPHLGPVRAEERRIRVVSLRERPAELRGSAEQEIARYVERGYHAEVGEGYLLDGARPWSRSPWRQETCAA